MNKETIFYKIFSRKQIDISFLDYFDNINKNETKKAPGNVLESIDKTTRRTKFKENV
jgi:hypothetical protein